MISLTYLSRATFELDQDQLLDLLTVSRARNLDAAVTGLLLYADEQFIQTLEGDQADIDATMSRILTDPRHRDVDITLVEDITERSFPDWSMGFQTLSHQDVTHLRGYSDYLNPDSTMYEHTRRLGRAGVFHRAFRDIRPPT